MKKPVAFISGINGQDGSYLAELLLSMGYEVHGLVRRASTNNLERLGLFQSKLKIYQGDVSDSECLNRLIVKIRPDEVYNLAAQSEVGASFVSPSYTAEINALAPMRILESIRLHCPECRYYQASTSEIYGNSFETPQCETTKFSPTSPYAIAKLHAYWTTAYFRDAYGIHASNGILFNHESVRRAENFVTRKIAMAIGKITRGEQELVGLGNLDAKRDWGYAPDYVRAMWMMLRMPKADDYVIATGESHSVREFCEIAFAEADISLEWRGSGVSEVGVDSKTGKVRVEIDPQFYRPTEIRNLIGNTAKAEKILGWYPQVKFRELVRIMVQHELRNK